jgi:hypothetical protein
MRNIQIEIAPGGRWTIEYSGYSGEECYAESELLRTACAHFGLDFEIGSFTSESASRRGRPPGVAFDTRKRIARAAAFLVAGWSPKRMAPYIFWEQHRPEIAESNTRRFLHDHRRRINELAERRTPASTHKLVLDIVSDGHSSQSSHVGFVERLRKSLDNGQQTAVLKTEE